MAGYLALEAKAGGLAADLDPRAAAELLIGACLNAAFLSSWAGQELPAESARGEAELLVRTLLTGIGPA